MVVASPGRTYELDRPALAPWTLRFAALFLLVHLALSAPVLLAQRVLPDPHQELLATFAVFEAPGARVLLGQLLRGAVLALVLYPFHPLITRRARAFLVSFGFFWGLSMVGSVEPLPGSIEGWIYTETTWAGHGLILVATAVQALLLAALVPRMEAWLRDRRDAAPTPKPTRPLAPPGVRRGTLLRFTLLHVATYFAMGVTFYVLQDYAAAFASQPQFTGYRPLDGPMVALAVPLQVPRGLLLAVCMLPFVHAALHRRHGWLPVFAVLFGATAVGTAGFIPGLLKALATDGASGLSFLGFGTPELFVQMLVFSALLMAWERRRAKARGAPFGPGG